VDGSFPNHHPDPSQPENLEDLKTALREQTADIGLAFDGDGDRLGVITAEGEIIWADRQIMLYAQDILARNPGGEIIFDIKCTTNLPKVIEAAGGKPTMWKTGHSLVKAKLKETGALLAGEMSGHIFFKERWYGFDDALYTAARLLEILSQDKRKAGEIFAELPDSINTPEIKMDMPEGEHFTLVERMVANADFQGASLTTIDGVRADWEDGFGLARASNTTPCIVFRFEATNELAMERIKDDFRRLVQQQATSAVDIPF
jgi:phosphomannomutase/phosphoglucomutase